MERRNPEVPLNSMEIDEVVAQVIAGDKEAFATLILTFERQIYTYCYCILKSREEAEDAVQDIFVKVYKELERYEKRVSFSAWLYKVAYHHCLDQIRKSNRRSRLISLYKELQHKTYSEPDEEDPVQKLFRNLTAEESHILILKVVEQYSYEEMEEIMDCSSATLRKKYERLRKKLVQQKKNEGESCHGQVAKST